VPARLAGGRQVIARADRIDLWKNLPRGFAAYERLLLLAENAGAYEQLAPPVTRLQPFDVAGTSAALGQAMTGDIPALRPEARALLRSQDAAGWLAGGRAGPSPGG
jgi:trehalose-6-phosphate synthase